MAMHTRLQLGINHGDFIDPEAFIGLLDDLIEMFEKSTEFNLRSMNHDFRTNFDESSRPRLWEPEEEEDLFTISTRS